MKKYDKMAFEMDFTILSGNSLVIKKAQHLCCALSVLSFDRRYLFRSNCSA